jgi:hypothetical protein
LDRTPAWLIAQLYFSGSFTEKIPWSAPSISRYQTQRFSMAVCWRERRAAMGAQASPISRTAAAIEVDMAAAR